MHRNALDHGQRQAGGVDRAGEGLESRLWPRVANRDIVQRADDAAHSGDLFDVAKRDPVVSAVPPKGHLHSTVPVRIRTHILALYLSVAEVTIQ